MNNNGQLGFAFLLVFFIVALAAFATIEPFKENLDAARSGGILNCPGTPDFNQTDYNDDTRHEKLIQRPTCFVTGITMAWFILAVLITGAMWVARNWTKKRR